MKCDKCKKDLPITVPPYQRKNWEMCKCKENQLVSKKKQTAIFKCGFCKKTPILKNRVNWKGGTYCFKCFKSNFPVSDLSNCL